MPPVDRHAARVICLDDAARVLLVQSTLSRDLGTPTFWITPGGGLDPGEDHEAAARRELDEECGLRPTELVGPVHHRVTEFRFRGVDYRQSEQFFLARVAAGSPLSTEGWTEIERELTLDIRWWTAAELAVTTETVYPEDLLAVLDGIAYSDHDVPAGQGST